MSQFEISKTNVVFFSQKIGYAYANSADSDELPHDATFYLGIYWLPKYLGSGLQKLNWSANEIEVLIAHALNPKNT